MMRMVSQAKLKIKGGGVQMDNRSLSHTRWKCQYHIVFIPKYRKRFVAQILVDIKKEQDELKDILGSEYQDFNLVMATTFGLPIGDSYLRDQMQKVIDEQGLPDVVFHSLRHTSVTYKLKLSGGDIKSGSGRFRTCTGGHGNRGIWPYH